MQQRSKPNTMAIDVHFLLPKTSYSSINTAAMPQNVLPVLHPLSPCPINVEPKYAFLRMCARRAAAQADKFSL